MIRVYALSTIPPGMDNDEGIYAYNGCRYLAQGDLHFFIDYGLKWETPIGYCIAVGTKLFGARILLIRYGAAAASIMLLLMFYLLGKSLWNSRVGVLAAAFAGVSFLLVFYGRLGWCASHVLLIDCIAFYFLIRYFKKPRYRWLIACALFSYLGLATYATFRAMVAFLFLASCILGYGLRQRLCAVLGSVAAPVVGYLLSVRLVEGTLRPILERGRHNIDLPHFSALRNYCCTLQLLFKRPPEGFNLISDRFFGDAVHALLYDNFKSPECVTLSLIIFFCTLAALVIVYRVVRKGEYRNPLVVTVIWAFTYFIIVGYVGPSYTRLLGILIPLILLSAYVTDAAIFQCTRRSRRQGIAVSMAIIAVAAIGLGEVYGRLGKLGATNSHALFVFNGDQVQMIKNAKKRSETEERVLLFSRSGREVVQYLTFDIPSHDSFTDFMFSHFSSYALEKKPMRLYVLLENSEARNLIRRFENGYQGVRSEKFHISETGMDYVELLVPSDAKKKAAQIGESTIRKPSTGVNIFSGGMGSGPGEYNEPRSIAMDGRGNIYIADFRNYRIQKFDSYGRYIASWGEEGDAPGQFADPCGVAVGGGGNVYVADTFNNRVQVFTQAGKYLFHFRGGFSSPRGLAIDAKGRIWVADTGSGMMKLFSGEGKLQRLIGRHGSGKGEFNNPIGIAIDRRGNIYVADVGNRRVQILNGEGNYVREFKVDGWQQGGLNEPYLDVDDGGDIYLTDPLGHRALRYSAEGKLLGILKPMQGDEPLLSFPMGITVVKRGQTVYVADCRHNRIRKFSKSDFK